MNNNLQSYTWTFSSNNSTTSLLFGLDANPRHPLTTSRIKLFCNRLRHLCMLTTNAFYVLVMSGGRQNKSKRGPQLLVRSLNKLDTHYATTCMWAGCKSMPTSFSISFLCVSECLYGQAMGQHAPTLCNELKRSHGTSWNLLPTQSLFWLRIKPASHISFSRTHW